ncbi:hypothetical protein LB533_03430 [Mesorhizobium sp. BR1-1-13]|uniref:hypothetical protein n=1 Tax=Mesorhizobium sp. BR1-1-13 TaxID=2876656 RepID=UPI001CD04A7F|nr:hypothetical protein [Mesorhizobium sp. BR1-1-13]MBZ9940151.1 hypothetical protein [Mesorhizobium sp. BR1-1-13]
MGSDILQETVDNPQAMRTAIGSRFKWYYHLTPIGNADDIRAQGLLPHSDANAPQQVLDAFGAHARKIVCVNPLGTDIVPPPVQSGPFICLAFENEALPRYVGLDWSYGTATEIAQVLRNEDPSKPAADIFVEAIKRRGSMIAYGPISPGALRVYTKGSLPHDPTRWPCLSLVSNAELLHFG